LLVVQTVIVARVSAACPAAAVPGIKQLAVTSDASDVSVDREEETIDNVNDGLDRKGRGEE
jgi:hypothetical protein